MVEQAVVGFVAGAWLLAGAVVVLARASAAMVTGSEKLNHEESRGDSVTPDGVSETDVDFQPQPSESHGAARTQSVDALSTDLLLLNVLVTQGGVIVLVAVGAILTGVPMRVLGITSPLLAVDTITVGLVVGLGLYLVDEVLSVFAKRFGHVPEELLRAALTPDSAEGWILLFCLILPLVAVGEEMLFRAALLGATPLLSGLPTLGILAMSSILFGLAHAVQGRAGVVVAGVLGLGLGSAYLVTGNLVVVVVAHYVVNALEFVVHELLEPGFD
jgi:membrane protease YdiL (CAAX protease family)